MQDAFLWNHHVHLFSSGKKEDYPYNQQNVEILPVKKDGMISLRFLNEEICKMKDCNKKTQPPFQWLVGSA